MVEVLRQAGHEANIQFGHRRDISLELTSLETYEGPCEGRRLPRPRSVVCSAARRLASLPPFSRELAPMRLAPH